MKLNKTKLLIPSLAIVAGACLVGSVSGTVAWYQYSTRVTAAYEGTSAHCTENLQIRLYQPGVDAVGTSGDPGYVPAIPAVASDWKQDLSVSDISTFLGNTNVRGSAAANKLKPVTSGTLAANSVPTNLYKNPIYQYGDTSSWGLADKTDYVDLPLQFRVLDVDGVSATQTYLAKKIYLSNITLAAKVAAKDATSALRVVVNNGSDFTQTFSSTGVDVNVGGNLDLNNDGSADQTPGYEWDTGRTAVKYGDYTGETPNVAKSQIVSSLATSSSDLKVADDSVATDIKGKELFTSSSFSGDAEAVAAKTDWAGITIRIYLEGWTALDSGKFGLTGNATPTTIWDAAKVAGDAEVVFRVGLRFTAEAHTTH